MRYRKLGRTGLIVSEVCLGTNTFGGSGPMWSKLGALDQRSATAIVSAAHATGINFIDTADRYGDGESEQHVGQALRDLNIPRSSVVIATKAGGRMGASPNDAGLSRAHLWAAVDASLERLQSDYIDVYMLHFPDPATPLEETLHTLDDLVRAGKIRYIGCSNFPAWQIMKGIGIAEREHISRFEVLQTHWSVATRDVEREILPMAVDARVGIMVWGPLLGGLLTGKFNRAGTSGASGRTGGTVPHGVDPDKLWATVDVVTTIARSLEVPAARVALSWLLHKPAVTSVLFGARTPQQVSENVGAVDVKLSTEDLARLDAVSALTPLYDGVTQTAAAMADRMAFK
jgi:aryl-alcohol dehydrogenase-like predicted oxidoreductase